jgi:hypothetical protein
MSRRELEMSRSRMDNGFVSEQEPLARLSDLLVGPKIANSRKQFEPLVSAHHLFNLDDTRLSVLQCYVVPNSRSISQPCLFHKRSIFL